jgi:hypothetical protein
MGHQPFKPNGVLEEKERIFSCHQTTELPEMEVDEKEVL